MKLHWLHIEQRVLYKVPLLTYKSLNGKGPEYFKEFLTLYVPNPTLQCSIDSRQSKLIVLSTVYRASKARRMDRNQLLDRTITHKDVSSKDTTILVSTYHPHDQTVPKIISTNWGKVTTQHFYTKNMWWMPLGDQKNLGDILVHASTSRKPVHPLDQQHSGHKPNIWSSQLNPRKIHPWCKPP